MQFMDEVLVITAGLDYSISPAAPVCVFPSVVALVDEACGESTGAVLVLVLCPLFSLHVLLSRHITVKIPQLPVFDSTYTFLLWC